MRTAEQWVPIVREMVERVRADPPYIGVLSTGEQCAVALVLDVDDTTQLPGYNPKDEPFDPRPRGYTWLDCVNRIEGELLDACIIVQREGP